MIKKNSLVLVIIVTVTLFVIYSLRYYFYAPGISLFAELLILSDFDWLINQFHYAWNDYFVLGHPHVGYPLAPGGSTLIQTTNPVTSLIDIYFLKLLHLIFQQYWQFINFFLAISLSFISMYLFARLSLRQSKMNLTSNQIVLLSSLAGIIYLINPMVGDRFGSGGVRYIFSQSLIPFFFYFYFRIKELRLNASIFWIHTLIFSLLFLYQVAMFPHFIIAFLFFVSLDLILSFFLFHEDFKNKFFSVLVSFSVIGLLNLLLFGYVLIPAILFKENFITNSESGFFSIATVKGIGSYATLENVLRILPYKNSTEKNLFYIYPLLFLIGVVFSPNRIKIYLITLFLFFLFLAKGINAPFESFSIFLFDQVPFLHAFRDSTKFMALVLVIYAWGFAFGMGYLLSSKLGREKVKFFYIPFFVFLIYILIFINSVFLTGNFNRILNKLDVPKEYFQIAENLNNKAPSKVAYLPFDSSIAQFDWYKNSAAPSNHFTPFHTYIPINGQLVNAYQNDYLNTSSQHFMKYIQSIDDPELLITMLKKVGVKYLVLDKNTIIDKSWSNGYFSTKYEKQLAIENNNLLRKESEFGDISLYEITENEREFTLATNIIAIVGDLSVYETLHNKNKNYLNSTFIFLEQPENYQFVDEYEIPIYFHNTDELDLVASKFIKNNNIPLNPTFMKKDNTLGWIGYEQYKKDVMMSLDNFGLTFLSMDLIGTETYGAEDEVLLTIPPGDYIVLGRLLHGNRYKDKSFGSVIVSVGDLTEEIDLNADNSYFKWHNLGGTKISGNEQLKFINKSGLGLIDGILFIRKDEYQQELEIIRNKINSHPKLLNLSLDKLNYSSKEFEYKEVNPTLIIINHVQGNLVYKQTYSDHWLMDANVKKYKADYYANGFIINDDIEKGVVYYKPQKLYSVLLALAKTLFVCIIAIIVLFLLNNKLMINKHRKSNL